MEIKYFLFWLPMIVLAFINAALRELVLLKHYLELQAHQISSVTLILFCSIYVWLVFPKLNILSVKQALMIGSVWVILTIMFEFILGRLTNKSWEYLLRDYNILAGYIWLIFLAVLFLLPLACYMIRYK